MEGAADIDQALAVAATCGIPAQNIVCADADGRIGWTIMGRIPRREGCGGRLPVGPGCSWEGWLAPADQPRIVDPESGRLWTANARVVGGDALASVGDGGYDLGARAGQIRDALLTLERADEGAMLAIQLDDRALFLGRWRALLLDLLDDDAVAERPRRATARRHIEHWGGRAATTSVGYRLVRAFRLAVRDELVAGYVAAAVDADPEIELWRLRQVEGALWRLVDERPPALLPPGRTSWRDVLLEGLDGVLAEMLEHHESLDEATWGARNTVRIRHPLSGALPLVGRWLDMPAEPLPGDSKMPRVQSPGFGASERLVVSPGHEENGLFHMPGGQSGHPLSPYYRAGHRAWVEGRPTPFLPGEPVHELRLTPATRDRR
jgi:penicillin amidase